MNFSNFYFALDAADSARQIAVCAQFPRKNIFSQTLLAKSYEQTVQLFYSCKTLEKTCQVIKPTFSFPSQLGYVFIIVPSFANQLAKAPFKNAYVKTAFNVTTKSLELLTKASKVISVACAIVLIVHGQALTGGLALTFIALDYLSRRKIVPLPMNLLTTSVWATQNLIFGNIARKVSVIFVMAYELFNFIGPYYSPILYTSLTEDEIINKITIERPVFRKKPSDSEKVIVKNYELNPQIYNFRKIPDPNILYTTQTNLKLVILRRLQNLRMEFVDKQLKNTGEEKKEENKLLAKALLGNAFGLPPVDINTDEIEESSYLNERILLWMRTILPFAEPNLLIWSIVLDMNTNEQLTDWLVKYAGIVGENSHWSKDAIDKFIIQIKAHHFGAIATILESLEILVPSKERLLRERP